METSGMCFKDWKLDQFDRKSTSFIKWINSFEYLCEILNKTDDEKVNCFLSMLRPSHLKVIKKKFPHIDPVNLPYDEIVKFFMHFFTPYKKKEIPNVRLIVRKQLPYETIEHYVDALEKLFNKCSPVFKSTVNITRLFIEGLENEEIRTYLKKNTKITLSEAANIAKEMELAQKSNQENHLPSEII